jgi:hypothetical protein
MQKLAHVCVRLRDLDEVSLKQLFSKTSKIFCVALLCSESYVGRKSGNEQIF